MTLHDFEVEDIHGEKKTLSEYEGKVVLIVNTALECEFAYQLDGFEELYRKYDDQDFIVLGFPSNSFKQEPYEHEEILGKCSALYNISFPLFSKIEVKGQNTHPLFRWLTQATGKILKRPVQWNFTKFLIDKDGNPVKRFSPRRNPEALEKHICALL